ESGGYISWQKLLESSAMPEAVVAANDLMAIGFMRACEEANLRIPEDIVVAGMDNLDISSRVHPKLTSVALMQEEIGRNAAQILMDRLQGEETELHNVRLMPRLVVRESSVNLARTISTASS